MNRKQRRAEKKLGALKTQTTPKTAPELFENALQQLQTGRADDAERLCRLALAADARHAPSLHLLGLIAFHAKRYDVAAATIRQAIAYDGGNAEYHSNLGVVLRAAGQLGEAVACYQKAVEIAPNYTSAHLNLGIALRQQKRLGEAVVALEAALRLEPDLVAALTRLGEALNLLGRFDEALPPLERAVRLDPRCAEAHRLQGAALTRKHRFVDAATSLQKAVELDPANADAYNELGNALSELAQRDDAVACYRCAIALSPGDALIYSNLGVVLQELGRFEESAAALRQAIDLRPDFAEAHNNLGIALEKLSRFDEADQHYRKAIELRPDYAHAHCNRGNLLLVRARPDDALVAYAEAIAADPDYLASYSNAIFALHYAERSDPAAMLDLARRFAAHASRSPGHTGFSNTRDPGRPLRIGYVSADLRAHPVGYFLLPVLAAHDRSKVAAFCYDNTVLVDEVTTRLQQMSDGWRRIAGIEDGEAAAMIERDGIDVLVDLSGHTEGNRLTLFARRPAPVQVSWLGYFGTTGLDTMDYILADRTVVTGADEAFYSEKVCRLPDSYLCFAPPDFVVAQGDRVETEPVVLGCFNHIRKITPGVVALWADILAALPAARLFLKTPALNDPARCRAIADEFAAHGVAPERLILEGGGSRQALLAAYNRIDIALDPFPYGGGTTTVEALWMGVPVVALLGDRWVARVSASMLTTIGLPELVAADRDDYVAKVVALAADRPRLAALHRGLRDRVEHSPLCDGARFTRALEAAYREMWAAWCREHPNTKVD